MARAAIITAAANAAAGARYLLEEEASRAWDRGAGRDTERRRRNSVTVAVAVAVAAVIVVFMAPVCGGDVAFAAAGAGGSLETSEAFETVERVDDAAEDEEETGANRCSRSRNRDSYDASVRKAVSFGSASRTLPSRTLIASIALFARSVVRFNCVVPIIGDLGCILGSRPRSAGATGETGETTATAPDDDHWSLGAISSLASRSNRELSIVALSKKSSSLLTRSSLVPAGMAVGARGSFGRRDGRVQTEAPLRNRWTVSIFMVRLSQMREKRRDRRSLTIELTDRQLWPMA